MGMMNTDTEYPGIASSLRVLCGEEISLLVCGFCDLVAELTPIFFVVFEHFVVNPVYPRKLLARP